MERTETDGQLARYRKFTRVFRFICLKCYTSAKQDSGAREKGM